MKELKSVWGLANSIDWHSKEFQREKAHVCCIFSKLAYAKISNLEIDQRGRIKIVPCEMFQKIIRNNEIPDLDSILRNADLADYFTIVRNEIVIVGVLVRGVLIIAIRGTIESYDWFVNLKAFKNEIQCGSRQVKLHSGFYGAITSSFEELRVNIEKYYRRNSNLLVYVTGHSLGGGMAAIMHALWEDYNFKKYANSSYYLETTSCYTFGMPRYGNKKAVEILKNPYHTYDDKDIVPTVPPKILGYANSKFQYNSKRELSPIVDREKMNFARWIINLITKSGLKSHYMENYMDSFSRELIKFY